LLRAAAQKPRPNHHRKQANRAAPSCTTSRRTPHG
jgi:hypothetical protein